MLSINHICLLVNFNGISNSDKSRMNNNTVLITDYLGDKNRFDVSSKGPSSLLLPSDVDIRYLHWPRIEVRVLLSIDTKPSHVQ